MGTLKDIARRWVLAWPALGRAARRVRAARPSPGAPGLLRRRLLPRLDQVRLRVRAALGLNVSRDQIVWCYRNLLHREPESEAAIQSHSRVPDMKSLVASFVQSREYRMGARGDDLPIGTPTRSAVPISAADFRRSIDNYLASRPAQAGIRAYVDVHFDRLLHTINVLQDTVPPGAALIDYSAAGFFSHAVRQLLGDVSQTSVTGVNFELDDYVPRFGENRYDMCVNTEVLEHLLFNPAHMVHSINRMLRPGGLLFLTTPNAISMANALKLIGGHAPALWNQFKPAHPYYERHNREWSPFEVARLLQEHGFEIVQNYTLDSYASTREALASQPRQVQQLKGLFAHEHFGDTLCVLARKVRHQTDPVQADWLYG